MCLAVQAAITRTFSKLDSDAITIDRVFQDIETRENDVYVLGFEFRERTVEETAHPDTNKLEVFWDGESLGVYNGVAHWQTVTLVVNGASDEMSRLEFRESVEGSDGRGPLIDNVTLVKVSQTALTNANFEATAGTGPIFQEVDVAGWNTMDESRQVRVEPTDGSNGGQYLSIDTGTQQLDRIYQSIRTDNLGKYYLTFDVRGSAGEADEFNELRVRFNDGWAGTFQATNEWQTYGILVDASDTKFTTLMFREVAHGITPAGTGNGVCIDNVRIHQVGEFEPFAGVGALAQVEPAERDGIYNNAPAETIDTANDYSATIELENGNNIDVVLYDDDAPVAVNNFYHLVQDGWYDGLFFNRVVNDGLGDPFVAQAGGPHIDNTGGGPGYTFGNEIVEGLNFDSRRGLLAMANTGAANSNGSQFFITYGTPSSLNGDFTIFGEIELSDTESFNTLDNLVFRNPQNPADLSIVPDFIKRITITMT